MMFLKKLVLLLLPVLTAFISAAQTGKYQFAHLDFTQGLSHNQVSCIYKDARGMMWFGTMSGLNRYDGYTFKVFKHNIKDSLSLNDNFISAIEEGPFDKLWIQTGVGFNIYDPATEKFDRNAARVLKALSLPQYGLTKIVKSKTGFWFLYADSGLYKFEPGKKTFVFEHADEDNTSIQRNTIADIKEDSKGNLWIVHRNGWLEKLNVRAQEVTFRTNVLQQQIGTEDLLYNLYIDAQDELWVYATGKIEGVYYYKPAKNEVLHFAKDTKVGRLSNNIVDGIVQDDKGLMWIATDHGGVNILDKKSSNVNVVSNKPDDDKSLAQNSVSAVYKDNLGIVWLGTFKRGISYYHESLIKFPLYRHQPSNANSLSYDDINRFVEDAQGNIWIGTNGGGLIYFNRKTNTFKQFTHDPANANSLSNNVVVCLFIDHNETLWIGTYYGGLDSYDGKTFTHHRHNDVVATSLADDRVWSVYEDSEKNLWVGTLEGGLDKYDREHNIFYHHKTGEPNGLAANYIPSITEDNHKNIWIATSYGINVIEKNTGKIIRYSLEENKLSNNNLIALLKDSRGNIWAGTREGLNVFIESKKQFQTFRTEDGLPDNAILSMLEDDEHNLWISTPNGISKVTVYGDQQKGFSINCKNYDELDGLQGREFNSGAGLKTREGELIFGGPNGFNIFNPKNITTNKNVPPVVLTGFQLFNRTINIGEKINNHVVLPKAISETNQITLKYNENVFSIEFASLSYANTQKNEYAYILEGFNNQWLTTDGKTRKATFTNLDPGAYTFRVKASNDDGVWNSTGIALKIIILPPWWKTPLAYALYVVVIATVLYFSRRMVIQRARIRFALEQERKEAHRMHELDMMKIRFFTNVSHEFRTPLSLILTPLDKMIKQTNDVAQKTQFLLMRRNAKRLLNMVNQLLDFRKLEVQELKLQPTKGDIVKFIKDLSYSFTDIAEKKSIYFDFSTSVESLYTNFDHDKIERIIFNLLSNAFKFTPENGEVSVNIAVQNDDNSNQKLLQIIVVDTGIGIDNEKQERIFERFFQNDVPGSMINQGSGIGLAIVKEFVKMHNGNIAVQSEPGKGSSFVITLPVEEIDAAITNNIPVAEEVATEFEEPVTNGIEINGTKTNEAINGTEKTAPKKPLVLLVEDNEDFRFYLKDNLRECFTIVEAANGKEGWQKTLSSHPDLIVSDISMPEMNGIDLCKKIKADKRTSFIPVILLTALMGEEQQLKGLETGANDYMTKPFNFEILLSKIKNLLAQKESFKKTYQKQVQANPSQLAFDSPDEKFIQQALDTVEKNMNNDKFSVEDLSRELYLSRVALYKKLLALTGKTPIEFIRSIRLKRAVQLLQNSELTIAEIAYQVGFNNPKYFSKYFKEEFGMLPSEMKERGSEMNKA